MSRHRDKQGVRQLAGLLCMPRRIDYLDPAPEWFKDQAEGVGRLDRSLRRPNRLLRSIASRLDEFRARSKETQHDESCSRPKETKLCKSHYELDPKLIRRHLHHLILEYTERNDRLRDPKKRNALPKSVEEWLQRMDAVCGMWIGPEAFSVLYKYEPPHFSLKPPKHACEACIMSVIGGRVPALVDLRASLVSRTGSYGRSSCKTPRLSCLVESWIDYFGRDLAADIRHRSEKLADAIQAVRIQARSIMASPTPSHPVLRAETMVENVEREAIAEEPARARQWARNIDGRLDYSYVRSPPSTWGSSHEESNREHSESGSVREAQSSDLDEVETPGERAGLEASNWIDAHMKGIGLLPEERLKLFDDMHPALSDYAPASDIPSQLGTGRRPRSMHSGSESGRWPQLNTNRPVSVAGPPTSVVDESIWEPASVVSFSQSGSHVPRDSETVVAAPSTVSTVTSLAPDLNGRRNAPSLVSLPPDHGPYLAFCREMGLKVDPEILRQQQASSDEAGGDSPPPPSSIYSQD